MEVHIVQLNHTKRAEKRRELFTFSELCLLNDLQIYLSSLGLCVLALPKPCLELTASLCLYRLHYFSILLVGVSLLLIHTGSEILVIIQGQSKRLKR